MKISQDHLNAIRISQLEAALAQSRYDGVVSGLSVFYKTNLSNAQISADGTILDGSVDGTGPDTALGDHREPGVEEVRRDGPGSP